LVEEEAAGQNRTDWLGVVAAVAEVRRRLRSAVEVLLRSIKETRAEAELDQKAAAAAAADQQALQEYTI
jgi:hypothetical protein